MNHNKAKGFTCFGCTKYYTRKDRRYPHLDFRYYFRGNTKWKKRLKKNTARRSRRRKIDDETPYKMLDDRWLYD